MKQPAAEPAFQRRHLAAQRRLRGADEVGCPGVTAVIGDFHEGF
jgi:hypothetical protein